MKVLKKDFRRKKRKGGGMTYKWLGPYDVTQMMWVKVSIL